MRLPWGPGPSEGRETLGELDLQSRRTESIPEEPKSSLLLPPLFL